MTHGSGGIGDELESLGEDEAVEPVRRHGIRGGEVGDDRRQRIRGIDVEHVLVCDGAAEPVRVVGVLDLEHMAGDVRAVGGEERLYVRAVDRRASLESPADAERTRSVQERSKRGDEAARELDRPAGGSHDPASVPVSVVVPTYNGRDSLPRLLDGLARQTLPADAFEVVVVVDGSADGSAELLASLRPPFALRTIRQQNRGRAAAVNAGVAVAAGELVVLLDDDLEPEPGFLAAHLAEQDGVSHRGVVGAVRFRVDLSTPPFVRFWGARFEDFLSRLEARGPRLEWTETYTGAFSIRRDDLLGNGGFDEAFAGYGLEDFELALRLARAGVELRLCPEAIAYHGYDKQFAEAARDAERRGRSAVVFSRLHPDVDPRQFEPHDAEPPSVPRRLVRYVLPRMSRVLPFLPGLVANGVALAERRRLARLDFVYTLGLEYFFFLGRLRGARTR